MSAATVERKARPLSEWQKRRRAQRHVILAATHERALIADLNKVLRAIARSAAKLVEAGQYEQAQKVPNAYLSQLVRLFEGRLEATATASAQLVIEELTGNKSHSPFELKFFSLFEVAQAAIRLWITNYAAAKVVRIVETTRLRIRKSIERGNELNEPPRVLAKRIREETGGEIARRRAETIARTETGIAASVGADEAAQATNLQLDKRWVSTEDQRTRPTHHAANDQVRAMDKLFDVGGAKMRYPRDPNGPPQECINCRCIVLYIPKIPTSSTQNAPPPPKPAPFVAKPKSERVLHEQFFKDAPEALKEVIRQTADTVAVKNRKNARANWNGGIITMNSAESPGEYGATWRHEYGHHIDLSRGAVSRGATKEMASDSENIIKTVKAALPYRDEIEGKVESHLEELKKLSGIEQKKVFANLLGQDMVNADTLETYGRPLTSSAGMTLALRLHYYEKSQDWHRYLKAVYDAQLDKEAKTLALMVNDYVEATTKSAIAFGHGAAYYNKSFLLDNGVRRAQVLEAFANHIAITGSRDELASIFGKIVQRIAPKTWAKMQEIVDGLV